MQTTAIRTVANSLPENEVILLTLLISSRYIPYTDLRGIFVGSVQDNPFGGGRNCKETLSGGKGCLRLFFYNAGKDMTFQFFF